MYWNDLEYVLTDYLSIPDVGVTYVVAPFINPDLLDSILESKWNDEVVIITSWRKDHLLNGVSKLETYDVVKRHPNWTLYVNDRLHAKVYCHDMTTALVGSANLSYTALREGGRTNREVLTYVEFSQKDQQSLETIIQTSTLVNDQLYSECLEWYNEHKESFQKVPSDSIVEKNDPSFFLLSSLPASTSPVRIWEIMVDSDSTDESWNEFEAAQHDIENLCIQIEDYSTYDEFKRSLAEKMTEQRFFIAFMERIDTDGFRFGYGKEWVQTNCIDDPVPYRKELTRTVQNLFAWVVGLYPDEFEIIQPRHTQIIRRLQ